MSWATFWFKVRELSQRRTAAFSVGLAGLADRFGATFAAPEIRGAEVRHRSAIGRNNSFRTSNGLRLGLNDPSCGFLGGRRPSRHAPGDHAGDSTQKNRYL